MRAAHTEPIEERDDLGNLIGSFGAHDLEFALGYARSVGGEISWGASAQLLRERISNLSATTYRVQPRGGMGPGVFGPARVGERAQHGAGALTIDDIAGRPVRLPTALQTGVAAPASPRVIASGHSALEAASRAGVIGDADRRRSRPIAVARRSASGVRVNDSASTMSFGAGYAFPSLRLDYAFVPMNSDLGDTHRFAFSTRF